MPELTDKDRYDLLARVAVVLITIGLIAVMALYALYQGIDGVVLTTAIGIMGAVAGAFLGIKLTQLKDMIK